MVDLSDIAPSFSFIQSEGFRKSSDHYKSDEFGNADLVMAGPTFSLKFERDRGQIFVDIGQADVGWEKLEYALIFIDSGIAEEQLGVPPDVGILANLTRIHWKKISQLYGDGERLSAFKEFCKDQSSTLISRIFSKA